MTTAVLDRVPVDEIRERARQIKLGDALLSVLSAILMGLAWCAAKVILLGSFLLLTWWKWIFASLMVGWDHAAKSTKLESRPSRDSLMAENARLRQEIARLN